MAVQTADIAVQCGGHAVHFYEHDRDLAEAVGRFLSDALAADGLAVVIATEAHCRAFEAELEAAGLDPAQLRRRGALVVLDAAETLARIMERGAIDSAGFRRVIGSLICDALGTGRPVLAFGEMVALLWDVGDVLGALELEKLWNELQAELPFSLLCGYARTSVSALDQAEALEQVCQLHSSILRAPAAVASARFDPEREAPAAARRLVADALGDSRTDRYLLDDAQLVVSELATNAVRHARSPFSVTVRHEGSHVDIAVADASPDPPILRDAGPAASFGRGMRLVETIAEEWGVDHAGAAKVVWARLRA